MAAGVSAGLTAVEGRRFGLTVGGAFLLLAAFVLWRGRQTPAIVFGALGGTLGMAGLLVPSALGPVHRCWMGLATAISKVTTPVVMAVIYFLVITPIALLRRAIGGNPMIHTAVNGSYWHRVTPREDRATSMTRQF